MEGKWSSLQSPIQRCMLVVMDGPIRYGPSSYIDVNMYQRMSSIIKTSFHPNSLT